MNFKTSVITLIHHAALLFGIAAMISSCQTSSGSNGNNVLTINAPSEIQASTSSSSQIDISWNDNSDNEEGFKIERAEDNNGQPGEWISINTTTVNITSYNDTGLTPITKYYYRVKAYNSDGDSDYTSTVNATTQAVPTTAPSAPSNLGANAGSSTSINLTWTDNSLNENSFNIERSNDGINFTQISTTVTNIISFNNTGLSASTKYYYRVRAYNTAGYSAYSNVSSTTTLASGSAAQIIADHTVVDKYNTIPQHYIDIIKTKWFNVAGESHSEAYRQGLTLLQSIDSKFAISRQESGTPEGANPDHLRVNRTVRDQYGNWNYGTGEQAWYTSAAEINFIKVNHLLYSHTNSNEPSYFGFGWCWDMSWNNDPSGTIDPVYKCRWAGSSAGGPEGNLAWGLDAGDAALTGNSVCMDTYLAATQSYINYCVTNGINTKVFFTTGPVDDFGGNTEAGYQRSIKQQYIRDYVAADSSRILFDYADILCYNNNGIQRTSSWTDGTSGVHIFPEIHADNNTNLSGGPENTVGHIGSTGALRLAKAIWWMLARIEGWDGISAD